MQGYDGSDDMGNDISPEICFENHFLEVQFLKSGLENQP